MRLAQMGATVAATGRDQSRTEETAAQIRDTTGALVHAFTADLSAQHEVRRLAAELLASLPRIDVLVNNAGGYWNTRHVTDDGLERTFAINHLAPFLLTTLLLDRLKASPDGRVVTVASNAHSMGRIDLEDLQGQRDCACRSKCVFWGRTGPVVSAWAGAATAVPATAVSRAASSGPVRRCIRAPGGKGVGRLER